MPVQRNAKNSAQHILYLYVMLTMKKAGIILFAISLMSFTAWEPDFNTALKTAKEQHRYVLLNFSGSDWCGPCKRMHAEIFRNETFQSMADSSLVMVNADFPRNKKNQLSSEIRKQNESLADKYNPKGKFPFTLLLDAEGKVIRSWDGLPNTTAADFAKEISAVCHGGK